MWVSAHLFYQGSLDRVLTGLVGPLLRELPAERAFFLRYWDGGPHVRLRVLPADPADEPGIRDLIGERATRFFAAEPSADLLGDAEYLRRARRFGAREGVAFAERMYANNSAVFLPYEPEHRRYGTGASLAGVERHFHESSRLALNVVEDGLTADRRETGVLCFLLVSWLLAADDPARSARRRLARPDDRSEPLYDRQRARLRHAVTAMDRVRRGWPQLPDGNLRRWTSSLARMIAALDGPSPERVADLCAHLFANRVGVRIDTERSLRHLAARAVEDWIASERT
ncbi:hypothetical protein FAF44_26090 [Nonomuraea sp. MG754425]|nr:hypothetical protein [Nonomuraea sp. MG754425]